MRTIISWLAARIWSPVFLARVFFILLTTCMCALIAYNRRALGPQGDYSTTWIYSGWISSGIGFSLATVAVIVEYSTNAIASRKILLGVFGCMMGLIFAQLAYRVIPPELVDAETSQFVCSMMFGYFGIVLALKHSDWLRPGNLRFFLVNPQEKPRILDSSVIIDGRVNEMIRLSLLTGPIIVPNFVLREIQGIADSSDPHRRTRGRRGLDVLDQLRTSCPTLDVIDTDYPEIPEVDEKLIHLCSEMTAVMVTNDFNLQKIAQLRQVEVINLNEVADALKPMVYVGEALDLAIVKGGKEPGQGVGFLGDGTMVVVEDSADAVGQEREVIVTNILQNPAGRLIFAKLRDVARGRLHA